MLVAVRGLLSHAVSPGEVPRGVLWQIYDLADRRDRPAEAAGEDGGLFYRLRPLRHLREPDAEVDRAADAELVAMFAACRSARDRLVVPLLNGHVAPRRTRRGSAPATHRPGQRLMNSVERSDVSPATESASTAGAAVTPSAAKHSSTMLRFASAGTAATAAAWQPATVCPPLEVFW
ncbi:hypothetical protein [Actinacidiphila glaucinigra]|uniref:hypothetical protein n=1 Tax=Actinacidiphila glaucinigra TaxID=235986 RepID=UPI00366BA418